MFNLDPLRPLLKSVMRFAELAGVQRLLDPQDHPGGLSSSGAWEVPRGTRVEGSCTQFPGAGGAMLRILLLALCGLLTHTRADPGALLRLGMDIMNRGELAGPGVGPGAGGTW